MSAPATPATLARRIRRAVEWGDYVRGAGLRLNDAIGYREWLHFCFTREDLDVLVNFSLSDDTRPAAGPDAERARLVCIVRGVDRRRSQGHAWDGDVDEFDAEEVRVRRGSVDLRLGESSVRYDGDVIRVVVRCRRRPIAIDLTLSPVTVPSIINDMVLSDGLPAHWFLVPRLLASGTLVVDGRRIAVENVAAYHDHNWGYFRWGRDFAWVWGYGHPASADATWSITFGRQTNRAGGIDFVRGLAMWKDARQWRLFDTGDVELREEGLLRSAETLTLPRSMALLVPGRPAGVPAKLCGRASARGDVVEFEFRAEHVSRILLPNDDDLGLTVINEVSGEVLLEGTVHGERVEGRGRAIVEFLGA
jgi:hypothetical protein